MGSTPSTYSGLGSTHSPATQDRVSAQVRIRLAKEIAVPQKMVSPRSAPNMMVMARMPGVGGTTAWVSEAPMLAQALIWDMEIFLRLPIREAMGAISTWVMSPKTGMDMTKPASDVLSSRHFPLNSLMKKLTMDLTEPVSWMPLAMIDPKMMVHPMPPSVPPNPPVKTPAVFPTPYPKQTPASMPHTKSARAGWIFSSMTM